MANEKLIAYKHTPVWDKQTVPIEITHKHNTKVGTWGKITVISGKLQYEAISEDNRITETLVFDKETETPFVQPQAWHRVTLLTDDTRFFVSFYCDPKDYLTKKYDIRPHSEVREAVDLGYLSAGKVLDLGCGAGRNALYLATLGHEVTALDKNPNGLAQIQSLAEEEALTITTAHYDINTANIPTQSPFDLILSTVVFMFLDPERIPAIIADMQAKTAVGGYNLIVCAMDTAEHPCHMPFSFTFKEGELAEYYRDWELVKYNENIGHLHRVDANGNPITLQFATMLAKKRNS